MKKYLFVIPARLKSKRLPNKPIKLIKGLPMIVRTFLQCNKAIKKKNIVIATDSNKIVNVCKKYDIPSMLTTAKCLTGTDRVAEIAKKIKSQIYINLQGDEPIFPPADIKKFLKQALKYKKNILNAYCNVSSRNHFLDVNIPKLLFDKNENLIYMSRAPIPGNKKKKFYKAWRQVCIYSFPRNKLLLFNKMRSKTELEKIEDIEILRFIENGEKIKMVKLSNKSMSVDNKEDLKKVSLKIKKIDKT